MTGLEIVRTCTFFQEYKILFFKQLCERSKMSTFLMCIGKISPKMLATFGENLKLQMGLYPTAIATPPLIQAKEKTMPYLTWLV